MSYPIQEVNRKTEFFDILNRIHDKKDVELIQQLEDILKEENLNPCQIKGAAGYSIIGIAIIQDRQVLVDVLSRYSDDSKTPDELKSIWAAIAFTGKKGYLNKFAKKGDISNISKVYQDGTSSLSPFVYKHIISKHNKKGYSKSVNAESILNSFLIFFLENKSNINTLYKTSTGFYHPFVYYLLKPFRFGNHNYDSILNFSLKYGFDINLPFDNQTGDNFIQHFCKQYCTRKDNEHSPTIQKLNDLMDNYPVDFNYKNKDGLTLFDVLKEREFYNIIPLYEKRHILSNMNEDMPNQNISKKRL